MSEETLLYVYKLVEHQAALKPADNAIVHETTEPLSWQAYAKAIDEAAKHLAGLDIVAGDRVLIVAENAVSTAVYIFSASEAGAIAVPVNARMYKQEIVLMQDHASPRVVAFNISESDAASKHVIATQAHTHKLSFGTMAFAIQESTIDIGAEEIGNTAVILYTTGTTSAPKGVMLTHANLLFAGQTSAAMRGMNKDLPGLKMRACAMFHTEPRYWTLSGNARPMSSTVSPCKTVTV